MLVCKLYYILVRADDKFLKLTNITKIKTIKK